MTKGHRSHPAQKASHTEVKIGKAILERSKSARAPLGRITVGLESKGIIGTDIKSKEMCTNCKGFLRDVSALTGVKFRYRAEGFKPVVIEPSNIYTERRAKNDWHDMTKKVAKEIGYKLPSFTKFKEQVKRSSRSTKSRKVQRRRPTRFKSIKCVNPLSALVSSRRGRVSGCGGLTREGFGISRMRYYPGAGDLPSPFRPPRSGLCIPGTFFVGGGGGGIAMPHRYNAPH